MRNESSKSNYFCIPTVLLFLHKSLPNDRLTMPLLSSLWECSYKFELQSITNLLSRTAASWILTRLILCLTFLYTGLCSLDGSKWFCYLWYKYFLKQAQVAIYNETTLAMRCLSIYIFHKRNQFSSSLYTGILSSSYLYTGIQLWIFYILKNLFSRTDASCIHTLLILCLPRLYTGLCSLDGSKRFCYLDISICENRRELQSITKLL